MVDTPTSTAAPVKAGYKTTEFWMTLVSFIVSGAYLIGTMDADSKDSLIGSLQHAVESIALMGGQVYVLSRYMKSRKDAKIAAADEAKQKEHDALLAEAKKEQEASFEARVAAIEAEYQAKLALQSAEPKKPVKKRTPTKRKKPNG